MAKEKLENLSTKALKRRKRAASFILGLLIGVLLLCIVVAIFTKKFTLLATSFALAGTGVPMYLGRQKIEEELRRRVQK
jgi:uncharacterized membrane protein